jgi:hypothetical protein
MTCCLPPTALLRERLAVLVPTSSLRNTIDFEKQLRQGAAKKGIDGPR